uniref:Uncharacterized protein n=1 Tax=Heterorhabditis bacteriophora TaxID=37862 RepID=A0A1I7X0I1_HETBA
MSSKIKDLNLMLPLFVLCKNVEIGVLPGYAVQATNGLESQVHSEGNSPPLVFSRKDSVEVGMTKGCSKVNLPTNDITLMHEAIPFLPVPVALLCLFLNIVIPGSGISQFFTITFLFVGWFWSIAWGGLLIIHSMQYREALQQRRQEAVATAAIEALTKDSILHRRDVKTLVKTHKQQVKEKK